jgi:phosphatidylserine/phosphatidylglycerophosphate/cardiolipin synthase-like enzyme
MREKLNNGPPMHTRLAAAFLLISLGVSNVYAQFNVVLTEANVTTYFSPKGGANAAAVALIGTAQNRVLVAGYSFTSITVADALRDAHLRGVNVHVVLDKSNLTAKYSRATQLYESGVDVVTDSKYSIMHHKFIVADNSVAFGSMNFTKAGDERNAENFNVFEDAPPLATIYASEFETLYVESNAYHPSDPLKN